jgi:hypothetical protein
MMKKSIKTVSVAIPKKQFHQILDYISPNTGKEREVSTVATFLRAAITDFLSRKGYEAVEAEFASKAGRPGRRR